MRIWTRTAVILMMACSVASGSLGYAVAESTVDARYVPWPGERGDRPPFLGPVDTQDIFAPGGIGLGAPCDASVAQMTRNTLQFSFDPAGGEVTGLGTLAFTCAPYPQCGSESREATLEYEGVFDPEAGLMSGTVTFRIAPYTSWAYDPPDEGGESDPFTGCWEVEREGWDRATQDWSATIDADGVVRGHHLVRPNGNIGAPFESLEPVPAAGAADQAVLPDVDSPLIPAPIVGGPPGPVEPTSDDGGGLSPNLIFAVALLTLIVFAALGVRRRIVSAREAIEFAASQFVVDPGGTFTETHKLLQSEPGDERDAADKSRPPSSRPPDQEPTGTLTVARSTTAHGSDGSEVTLQPGMTFETATLVTLEGRGWRPVKIDGRWWWVRDSAVFVSESTGHRHGPRRPKRVSPLPFRNVVLEEAVALEEPLESGGVRFVGKLPPGQYTLGEVEVTPAGEFYAIYRKEGDTLVRMGRVAEGRLTQR